MENKVVITSKHKLLALNFKELLSYRDLIFLFFKRNYTTRYKQTFLGPLWLFITPLFSIFVYTIVFGNLAKLSTDGIPQPLFYLTGIIFWNYFSECANSIAGTFRGNADIFGKVYFPRLAIPASQLLTGLADFLLRFAMLLVFFAFYHTRGFAFPSALSMILVVFPLLFIGLFSVGIGLLVSSLTIKYRDLKMFADFILRVWMYGTPIVYSVDLVPNRFLNVYFLNPVTPQILLFKHCLLGTSLCEGKFLFISCLFSLATFFVGVVVFNKAEKTFIDFI